MPDFDNDCTTGVFCQQFRQWLPAAHMVSFNRAAQGLLFVALLVLGWIPILVWRGRSFSRQLTHGIIGRRPNREIKHDWGALGGLALRSRALEGKIMQAILLLPQYPDASLRVEAPRDSRFLFHIKYKTGQGSGIYLKQEADLKNKIAEHHLVFSTTAGGGAAAGLMRASIEFYDALGILQIYLTAGLSLGGVVWPKFGFRPTSSAAWEEVKSTIRNNHITLSRIPGNGSVLASHDRAIHQALAAIEPQTIWSVSQLEQAVNFNNRSLKLGDALLLGSRWAGVLDLADPTSRRIVSLRCGLRF
jgi:hypothetical protein